MGWKVIPLAIVISTSIFASTSSAATKAATGNALSGVLTRDLFGSRVVYIESKIGPAKEVYQHDRTYKVRGCELGITESDGNVVAFTIEHLSPRCTVDLTRFLGSDPRKHYTPADKLTFGQFEAEFGTGGAFSGECLGASCGASTDPNVYLTRGGSHVDNWNSVRIGVAIELGPTMGAVSKLEKWVEKEKGRDYLIINPTICGPNLNKQARTLFASVQITSISVGQLGDDPLKCDKPL